MAGFDRLHEKMKQWLAKALSCCRDEDEEDEWQPVIGQPYNFRREDVCIAGLSSTEQEGLRIRAVSDANRIFATVQPINPNPQPHLHPQSHSRSQSHVSDRRCSINKNVALTSSSSAAVQPKPYITPAPPAPNPKSGAHTRSRSLDPSSLFPSSSVHAATTLPFTQTLPPTSALSTPPRLDRVRAHTRALSNSLRSATASVTNLTPKSAGYASLPQMQQSPISSSTTAAATAAAVVVARSAVAGERAPAPPRLSRGTAAPFATDAEAAMFERVEREEKGQYFLSW